jgi:mRNA-degrading endonuclease toxin of MazEF toxin-antitoxin module
MSFEFGDVVLVPFPFTDQTTSKKRPAVVVSSSDYQLHRSDLILMPVTSQLKPSPFYGELVIHEWAKAGLGEALGHQARDRDPTREARSRQAGKASRPGPRRIEEPPSRDFWLARSLVPLVEDPEEYPGSWEHPYGVCLACEADAPVNETSLCAECSPRLERDLIQQRDLGLLGLRLRSSAGGPGKASGRKSFESMVPASSSSPPSRLRRKENTAIATADGDGHPRISLANPLKTRGSPLADGNDILP